VVAYNRYADQVGRLELRYDGFIDELSTILQRHAGRAPAAAPTAEEAPPPSAPGTPAPGTSARTPRRGA
jgi:biopolymer transport protein TolQ